MELDLGFEQLSDARWTEILPLIQQYRVLRLQDCGLTEARCKELGPALHTSPALVELDLGLNDLGDAGVHLVLRGLQSPSCKIQKLILQGCSLTHVGCGALPGALRRVPSLLELHLGGNVLGDAGLRLLCEGLVAPECHIVKLWLDSCNLTASSCEHLAAVLKAKPDFKELVLSNNDVQDAGVHTLCQALRGSACQLELLKLENCDLTPASCAEVCGALASMPSLQVLDMSRNKLGDKGIAVLCPELRRGSGSLRNLWLWQCGITAEGCKDLCGVLGMKPSLKELSLSMNELGDEGARLLCESLLQPGCQLESLWLDTCSFTAACCSYFRPVLLQSQSLLELRLCDNPLGDAGVQELCKALSSPDTALHTLCLVECEVSDASCSSLATVLQTNRSLRCLDLSNSCMGDPGVLQLLESLRQHNCALEKLILFDIYWTEAVEEQILILQEEKPNLRIVC